MLPASVQAGKELNSIPRQIGLTARYGLEGLADSAQILTEPLRYLTDSITPNRKDGQPKSLPLGVMASRAADWMSDAASLAMSADKSSILSRKFAKRSSSALMVSGSLRRFALRRPAFRSTDPPRLLRTHRRQRGSKIRLPSRSRSRRQTRSRAALCSSR